MSYLSHVIIGNGVAMGRAKVEAMLTWSIPKNLKELRGFLGLT